MGLQDGLGARSYGWSGFQDLFYGLERAWEGNPELFCGFCKAVLQGVGQIFGDWTALFDRRLTGVGPK